MTKTRAEKQARLHFVMTVIWGVVLALAVAGLVLQLFHINLSPLLWLLGVAFVSLCSIYANMGTHWGAYQGAKSEVKQDRQSTTE